MNIWITKLQIIDDIMYYIYATLNIIIFIESKFINILNFHSNENTEFTLIIKELERVSWLTLSLGMASQTERLR